MKNRLFLLLSSLAVFIFQLLALQAFAGIPPSIQMLNPQAQGEFAASSYTINWIDSDPDSPALIDLYYTPDNSGSTGTLIISGLAQESSLDSHLWDLSAVTPGSYYIRSTISDQDNQPVNAWSPGKIHVLDNPNVPSLMFISPAQVQTNASQSFQISWIDFDNDSDASISLYYDSNNSGADGTLIVSGISENDPEDLYIWDTSGFIDSRELWIYAVITDSVNPAVTVYSQGSVLVGSNVPPFFTFIEPDGNNDTGPGTFTITWDDADPDDNALISLYFSPDTSSAGTLITSSISEDSPNNSYIWDTSQVTPGLYYIKAVIQDSINSPITVWSSHKITVTAPQDIPPALQILTPGIYGALAGSEYTIVWDDLDPDSEAEIDLYYTPDSSGDQNDTLIISGLSEESSNDSYTWDLKTIVPGSYYIKGIINDFSNSPVVSWSQGAVHVVENPETPHFIFNEPSGNDDYPESSFTIRWIDLDTNSDALIDLYYDDNNSGANGTLIVSGISENNTDDFYIWDTSGFTSSRQLWVYAVVSDGINPPLTVYSPGPVIVGGANVPPGITILEPDGVNDLGPGSFTITWQDSDPDNNAMISLYYAASKSISPSLIVSGISEDDSADAYTWNTTGVLPGLYYIKAFISDGFNPAVTAWSTGMITVTDAPNTPPSITLIEPDGTDDTAGKNYTITWTDSDPDSSALISLYYTLNNTNDPGTLIVNNLSEDSLDNFYTWDISSIPQGQYYIRAIIEDSVAPAVQVYSPGRISIPERSQIPSLFFIEPSGSDDTSYSQFTIKWAAFDTDSNALIDLYFDDNNSGADGSLIKQGILENDGIGSYQWNTAGLGNNLDLWVYAVITDGVNPPVTVYSPDPVTIIQSVNTPPVMTITQPDGINDAFTGNYTITWTDSDPDDNAQISLYYSAVNYSAGKLIISGLQEDDPADSYTWDTSGISPGQYYIRGMITDNVNSSVNAWSSGMLTILEPPNTPPSLQIISPFEPAGPVSSSFTVTWADSDPDDNAQISLYYSENTISGGLLITTLSEDDPADSFTWNLSGVLPGTYYIRGVIQDSENPPVTSWSAGTITVTAPPNQIPAITLYNPQQDSSPVYESFTITWSDSDPDSSALINLYYSDINSGSGTLIVSGLAEDDPSDSYRWDLTNVAPGQYYIKAVISDGINPPVSAWSQGRITVIQAPNAPPQITIINPASPEQAQDFYTITWTDSDPDDNAQISLFYTVTPGAQAQLISSAISEDSNDDYFTWNLADVPAGTYYIKALISDIRNQPFETWSNSTITVTKPPNSPPSITIIQPDGLNDRAVSQFTIIWQASDSDDNAMISLYYNQDHTDLQKTLIIDSLSEDSETSYDWNISSLPAGPYYLYAQIDDSVNPPVTQAAAGPLVIDRTGSIRFIRVSSISQNSATITWSSDLNGTGTVYYGISKANLLSKSAAPARDHFITLTGLQSAQTYYFKVQTQDGITTLSADNQANYFTFQTASGPPQGIEKNFSGILLNSQGIPQPNTPVFMKARKNINLKPGLVQQLEDTQEDSAFISAITSGDGSFTLNTADLTDNMGNSFYPAANDTIILTTKTASSGTALTSLLFDPQADTSSIELTISGDDDSVTLEYSLSKGFNILSFPFTGISSMTARTVMSLYPGMTAFYRFKSDIQSYESCLKLDSSTYLGDFTLSPEEAYFIKSSQAVQFSFTSTGRIDSPPTLILNRGFNLTAIPYAADPPFNMTTGYNSKTMLNQTENASAIYIYSPETGQYKSILRIDETSLFGETAEITGGSGFFIKTKVLFNPLR
jgi:hypothetical protein